MSNLQAFIAACTAMSLAYGHDSDYYDYQYTKSGSRLGFVKRATMRINNTTEPFRDIDEAIMRHPTSPFAVY